MISTPLLVAKNFLVDVRNFLSEIFGLDGWMGGGQNIVIVSGQGADRQKGFLHHRVFVRGVVWWNVRLGVYSLFEC